MIIEMDSGPGYTAVWSIMHNMFVPCKEDAADLGKAYEDTKARFKDYADNRHDHQDMTSAEIYMLLLTAMEEADKKLRPFQNEWWRARHGLGLN